MKNEEDGARELDATHVHAEIDKPPRSPHPLTQPRYRDPVHPLTCLDARIQRLRSHFLFRSPGAGQLPCLPLRSWGRPIPAE